MKNKIFSILFYIISIFLIIIYFYNDFIIKIHHNPILRVIILLIISILMHFGAIFGSKYNKKYKYVLNKINLIIWFILYLILILTLTLFDSYFLRSGSIIFPWNKTLFRDYMNYVINLIPFKIIFQYTIGFINDEVSLKIFLYNILGNFLAFMPFALFLPRLFEKENNMRVFIFTMIIIVLLIEICQFITLSGTFDIDDLILNVGGSFIMYKILKINKVNIFINKLLNN